MDGNYLNILQELAQADFTSILAIQKAESATAPPPKERVSESLEGTRVVEAYAAEA